MKTIVGIDPGVRAMGLAIMQASSKNKPIRFLFCDVLKAKSGIEWFERVSILMYSAHQILEFINVDLVACECPQMMSGPRGRAAMARGDVVHLAHCSGMAHALANTFEAEFDSVNVGQWKGNLKDEIVWNRINRLVTHDARGEEIKSHALDAVGIGLCSFFETDMRDTTLWGRK